MTWYSVVSQDISQVPNFLAYYETQLADAKKETSVFGKLEKNIAALPGITEHRFNQLQEIEAVLNFINIEIRRVRRKHFQKYLEGYNRQLSSRDAEKYVDGEQEVITYELIANQVALLRNQFLGIMKGLESKNFMLGHITRLRAAGLEDISVS